MEHVITIENVRNTISKWKKRRLFHWLRPNYGVFTSMGMHPLIDQARKIMIR